MPMIDFTIHPALHAAEKLAPCPAKETARRDDWARHFAARGLAAYVAFDAALATLGEKPQRGSRPDLGILMALATSSTAAAAAVLTARFTPRRLWALTPDHGALNGEYEYWLAETLDGLGINPAAIDSEFDAAHFKSPMPLAERDTSDVDSMTTREDPFKAPLWWKLWFAFCAVLGLGLLGLLVWAVVEIVGKVTR